MNNYFTNTFLRKHFLRFGLVGLVQFFFSGQGFAANVNLAWDASKSANVGGYIVSYGEASRKYISHVDVGNKTSLTISGAKEGVTYYAAVKAYDSTRKTESGYSNEISRKIPAATTTPGTTSGTNTGSTSGTTGGTTQGTTGGTSGGTAGGTAGGTTQVDNNNGLVAAYGFEEGDGNTVADASGKGNHGTIKEAVRIAQGRYGKALQFDGVNDWVTINDSPSLDLSTGMTLEAWVYPQSLTTGGKTVIMKEQSGGAVYNLYANEDANRPLSSYFDGKYRVITGPNQLPENQWTHLVTTYDGQYGRLYVNGVEVAKGPSSTLIQPSDGVLRIGGNSVWGEFFKGLIDEVRIYNRALTAAEVQNNMKTAISVSNPPKAVLGNQNEEPWIEYVPQGIAQAFQSTPAKNRMISQVRVYLDASTTATQLVAGIYKDNNGHPGELIAQGKLNTVKPEAWNTVPISGASVAAGKPYWIAILGLNGEVGFLDQVGSGNGLMEKSTGRTPLKDLPKTWQGSSAGYKTNASMSAFGSGY